MTFSERGFNGLSANFHDFVNNNIVRGDWKNIERPVLINDWEACFFKFTRRKAPETGHAERKSSAWSFSSLTTAGSAHETATRQGWVTTTLI